jgi:excisionase family DNA binding protein
MSRAVTRCIYGPNLTGKNNHERKHFVTAQRRYRIDGYFSLPEEREPAPTPATGKGTQEQQQTSRAITPALLTIEEAARYLSIGRSKMYSLLAGDDPVIASLRIGERQRRVRRVDLDRFIGERLKAEKK